MIRKVLKIMIPWNSTSKKIYYIYKISRFFYKHKLTTISDFCTYWIYRKYHCCISYKSIIGKDIEFQNPIGGCYL